MKQRWRLSLSLLLLLLLGSVLLVPSVRWPIYGWLRGEAFFQRMPTSWWRSRIQRYLEEKAVGGVEKPWIARLMARLGISASFDNPLDFPDVLGIPDAIPMLIDLLLDDDAMCFAACDALFYHGNDAKSAESALLKMLNSPQTARRKAKVDPIV